MAAQTERQLTARELFYTPVSTARPEPPKAESRPSKPAVRKPTAAKPSTTPPTVGDPGEQAARVTPGPQPQLSSGGKLVSVSAGPPLALRYSLLKMTGSGTFDEVDVDSTFRSGDKIQLSVEANDDAYLYVVQKGSSGEWSPLFPNDEFSNNHVQRNRRYTVPAGGRFSFDEQAGTERLIIMVTRKPVPDIEKLIYSLQSTGTEQKAAPTEAKTLMAQNHISDDVMSRVRAQFVSRDLVFEKVDETKPGPRQQKEKAAYAATANGSSDASVIVELNLKHQ